MYHYPYDDNDNDYRYPLSSLNRRHQCRSRARTQRRGFSRGELLFFLGLLIGCALLLLLWPHRVLVLHVAEMGGALLGLLALVLAPAILVLKVRRALRTQRF